MEKNSNLLYLIENYLYSNKIDPSIIKTSNISIWPAIRLKYSIDYDSFRNKKKNVIKIKEKKIKTFLNYILNNLKRFVNILYGFNYLFRKYKYVIFTSTLENRLIDDRQINKLFEPFINNVDSENVLIIETPLKTFHYKRSELKYKNTVSSQFFKSFGDLILFFNKKIRQKNLKIENESLFKEIQNNFGFKTNYRSHISHILKLIYTLKIFYKIWKPRAILLSCYYIDLNYAAIYTAKINGIKTIEFQHGIINENHLAYNIEIKMDDSFFPDYFLSFGNYFSSKIDNGNFIDKKRIIPIGSYYLNYIKNEYVLGESIKIQIDKFKKKYKYIVAFTSQWTVEAKSIDFLKKVLSISDQILIIYIPRYLNKDYSSFDLPESLILMQSISSKLDAYKVMKFSDIHSTVYSTCAFEAIALEKPNLLLNIDNLSKIHLNDLIKLNVNTYCVDSPEEFVNIIGKLQFSKNNSEIFFEDNNEDKIKKIVDEIINI